MTTRKEMSKINKLRDIIRKNKKIGKVQLVMASGMSISYFNNIRPFLLEIYQHEIEYDPIDKLFKYHRIEKVET